MGFIWASYESFHRDLDVLGGILTFLDPGWYSGNIYSAMNSAYKYNRALENKFFGSMIDRLDGGLFTTREQVGIAPLSDLLTGTEKRLSGAEARSCGSNHRYSQL